MTIIRDFRIVKAANLKDFERQIVALLNEHYYPQGAPFNRFGVWYQAMYKNMAVKDKKASE